MGTESNDLVSAGDKARDSKHWSEASANYRAALALQPGMAHIWVQLGHALKEQGQYKEALEAYDQALQLEPDVADTHLQRGHALKLLGRTEATVEAYKASYRLDKNEHARDELIRLGDLSLFRIEDFSPPAIDEPQPASREQELVNPPFDMWPNGLRVRQTTPFQEFCPNCFLRVADPAKNGVTVAVSEYSGFGMPPGRYSATFLVEQNDRERCQIVFLLDVPRLESGEYFLNLYTSGVPLGAPQSLHIEEIFLGRVSTAGAVSKVKKIIREVRAENYKALINRKIIIAPGEEIEAVADQAPCLVVQLRGSGSCAIHAISLRSAPVRSDGARPPGCFEDPAIEGQIKLLKLSPHWTDASRDTPRLPTTGLRKPAYPDQTASQHQCPFVQIVIPVFNAGSDLLELVDSIGRHTRSAYEVLLVDDGSLAFTRYHLERMVEKDPRIRLLPAEQNAGYTRAANRGLRATNSEFVALVNSDVVVTRNWLPKLLAPMLADDGVAAVGPLSNAASWQSVPLTKVHGEGDWAVNQLPLELSIDDYADIVEAVSTTSYPEFPLLNGFCTLYRRSALEAVDFLDDRNFPVGYGEENDLCVRLRSAGYRLVVADDCYVFHKKSKSFGNDARLRFSKVSNQVLRSKHPNVDFAGLERMMRGNPAVNTVRERLLSISLQTWSKSGGAGDLSGASATENPDRLFDSSDDPEETPTSAGAEEELKPSGILPN